MLTQARLKELLHYDPETGIFRFIANRGTRARSGNIAGSLQGKGYLSTWIDGHHYKLHRLAWLYMTGEWPSYEIDHIDGVKDNNSFRNLRDIQKFNNLQNLKTAKKSNKVGLLGVSLQNGKPKAKITINGKQIHLGYFDTVDEAHAAYINAKRELHECGTL